MTQTVASPAKSKSRHHTGQNGQTPQDHTHAVLFLARSAIILFVSGVLGSAIAFWTKIVAARYFGPELLGSIEFVNTILGVAIILCSLGIMNTITYYIPMYEAKKQGALLRGFVRYAVIIPLVAGLIIGALVFVGADWISAFFNTSPWMPMLLRMIGVFMGVKMLNESLSSIFLSKKYSFYASLGSNVVDKIVLLATVYIIGAFGQTVVWYIGGMIVSMILTLVVNAIVYRKLITLPDLAPKYKTKEWLLFALPLLFSSVVGYILGWTDNFVISKFFDPQSLGTYSVAFAMASYIAFVPALLLPVFMPLMTQLLVQKKKILTQVYNRMTVWSYTLALFGGIIFIFFPRQIITVLFGDAFGYGATSLVLLSISFVLSSLFIFCNPMLVIYKRTSFILKNTVTFAVLNLVADLVCITFISKNIALVATCTATSLLGLKIAEYLALRRHFDVSTPYMHLIKVTLCAIISGAVIKLLFIMLFNASHLPLAIKLIIAGAAYVILFVVCLLMSKAVTQDDKSLLTAVLTKAKASPQMIERASNFLDRFS